MIPSLVKVPPCRWMALYLLVVLTRPTPTQAQAAGLLPEVFYLLPINHPNFDDLLAISQPQEPAAFPICGGAQVVDATTPFQACQDLIRGGLRAPQDRMPYDVTTLSWDSDPPQDPNPFDASDPAAPWPANVGNITAPLTWNRGRCSITVGWVLGHRPPERRIVRSLTSISNIADNLAYVCIYHAHHTQGSWKIRSIEGRGQGLDEMRVTVAINAGDDVIRDVLLETLQPAGMTEQEWNLDKMLTAQSEYYYLNHSRVYP